MKTQSVNAIKNLKISPNMKSSKKKYRVLFATVMKLRRLCKKVVASLVLREIADV